MFSSSVSISQDPALKGGRDTDIVIPLMGETKAGKSSLINRLVGSIRMPVGDDLYACTKNIQAAVVDRAPNDYPELNEALRGRRIVFLDTPGFDDVFLGDDEVLRRIVKWLEATYRKHMLVGGVLYLHDSTKDAWTKTSQTNLKLFAKICGNDALSQVSFVTTKWDDVTPAKLERSLRHAAELKDKQWSAMIAGGASVRHLRPPNPPSEPSSAGPALPLEGVQDPWQIVHAIVVSMDARDIGHRVLQIQRELVDQNLFFIESAAGKALRLTLQDLLNRARELQNGIGRQDVETLREVQKEIAQLRVRLDKLNPEIHKRLNRWFRRLGKSRGGK